MNFTEALPSPAAKESLLGVSAVAQWVKDLTFWQLWYRLQLWLGLSPWPGNFHMLQVSPNKEKKKGVIILKCCLLKIIFKASNPHHGPLCVGVGPRGSCPNSQWHQALPQFP